MSDGIIGSISTFLGAAGDSTDAPSILDPNMLDGHGRTTPQKFKVAKDNRSEEGTGSYPYQSNMFKSRSGHNIVIDDTKGKETITIQHRSGSAIQLRQDGSVHITAHVGRYDVTFGPQRMTVTGANDMTIKGDMSMRVYGDLNTTVHKDYNLTVIGDYNVVAKNHNKHIRGDIHTQAKNEQKNFEGSSVGHYLGGMARVSKGAATISSQASAAHLVGATGLHMHMAGEGPTTIKNEKGDTQMQGVDGKLDVKMSDAIKVLSENGTMDMIAQKVMNMLSQQGNISVKAAQGSIGVTAPQSDVKVTAGQNAGLEGGTSTTVASPTGTVNVKAQNNVHVDADQQIHFAGGLAGFMPDLNLLDALFAGNAMAPDAVKANQPQAEQDDGWVDQVWKNYA